MFDPALTGISFLIAILVGSTGIGGLLLAPAINIYSGIPIHAALPASMLALLFSGVVGTAVFGRKGSIVWIHALPLAVGAAPGAFFGSFTFSLMPSDKMQLVIATIAVMSGVNSIYKSRRPVSVTRLLGPWALVTVGMGTGFLSALTGSSGPLVLLPILLWMSLNVVEAVGLAQVVQIPIGLFATVGNLAFGRVDLALAVLVGIPVVAGSIVGALIAHRFSTGVLKVGASLVLISAGAYYAFIICWP